MASTKEDEKSMLDALFGFISMMLDALFGFISLGASVGKKDNETEPARNNGTEKTPTKLFCSACGKKSDTLKKCNGCLCVWYCDKKCQNKHRKEHKKECKVIKKELDKRGGKLDLGTELNVGPPLGELSPQEECPICMQVLPIHASLRTYSNCCGKLICGGCGNRHNMKQDAERGQKQKQPAAPTCAFCRTTLPKTDEEIVARLQKRAKKNDPNALLSMAINVYGTGQLGLPVDQAKCIDLLRQSDDLGFPPAQAQLGDYYYDGEMGLEQNEEVALRYWEKAAEGGHLPALYNLGCIESNNGNSAAALHHLRLAASGGHKISMGALVQCFEAGLLQHKDLAETLKVFYRARAEMKSEDRDKFIKLLKEEGNYQEEYDL